jgi:cell division protein FtsB
MRILVLILLIICGALQYRLWLGQHSVKEYFQHKEELKMHQASNLELEKRNKMLQADVADLQQGLDSIEERARNELGLIKQDEVFFRLITPQGKK